jgi:hypothetical protein
MARMKNVSTKVDDKRKTMPHLVKKGQVLNPKGRPKGSVNKYTQLARELLSSRGEEIVEVVIAKALKGDVHCLKMCMDRIVPAQKAVEIKHTKSEDGLIINVGTSAQIEEMAKDKVLKNPKTKKDDVVIAELVEEDN